MANLAKLLDHLNLVEADVRDLTKSTHDHGAVLDYLESSYQELKNQLVEFLVEYRVRKDSQDKPRLTLRNGACEHLERAGHMVTLVKNEMRVYVARTRAYLYVHIKDQ